MNDIRFKNNFKAAYSTAIPDSVQSTCAAVADANGCIEMPSGTITTTEFKCTVCNSKTFYLDSGTSKCEYRTVIPQCKTYEPNLNACSLCENGSFLSQDHLSCILNPEGVPFCSVPSTDMKSCILCENNYYLDEATRGCLVLPAEDKKLECLAYGIKKQCINCSSNYFLTPTGECLPIIVNNCAVLKDEK